MKIFDYKFLILLGLSLVVYFIYREVEYLRGKVDKLEKDLKNRTDNSIIDNKQTTQNVLEQNNLNSQQKALTNKPILALPKSPEQVTQEEPKTNTMTNSGSLDFNLNVINDRMPIIPTIPTINIITNKNEDLLKSSPKMISVDMSPSKATEQTSFTSGVKLTKIANKKKTNSDSETCSDSSSSKHLAIYSNDNEQYEETQNSLLESIESNKLELNFNYDDKIQISKIDTNVNELISMVTSQVDSENESEKISENKSESEVGSINEIGFSNDKQSSSSEKMVESELEKKKLPELKKIAEANKITLTKKINGQQKPKNKQELIKEILGQKVANAEK